MIRSIYKIEFVPVSGDPITLLDYGDGMTDFPKFPMQQGDAAYVPSGSEWGIGIAMGGAGFSPSWSRRHFHESNAAAATFCHSHPASLPKRIRGKFRVSVQDGGVFEYADARILAASTVEIIDRRKRPATITEYRTACNEMTVISDEVTFTPPDEAPGIPPALVPGAPQPVPSVLVLSIGGDEWELAHTGTGLYGMPTWTLADPAITVNHNGFFWSILLTGVLYTGSASQPWLVPSWNIIPPDEVADPQPILTPIF